MIWNVPWAHMRSVCSNYSCNRAVVKIESHQRLPLIPIFRCKAAAGARQQPKARKRLFSSFRKKNPATITAAGFFWSCWADLSRRSHPYQLAGSLPPLVFQGFRSFFPEKDEVGGTLCSVVSVRSFPRVGQRVGQQMIFGAFFDKNNVQSGW